MADTHDAHTARGARTRHAPTRHGPQMSKAEKALAKKQKAKEFGAGASAKAAAKDGKTANRWK